MAKIQGLRVEEVKRVAHTLAREIMTWDEPIPDFETRYPNILESCLLVPFQTYSRKHMYKGLIAKAAILFYLMIKNHPFENGNKRIALTTLLYFLLINERWLKVDNVTIYNFAVWVAQSPALAKEGTVDSIEKFISSYLINA